MEDKVVALVYKTEINGCSDLLPMSGWVPCHHCMVRLRVADGGMAASNGG
jgi:hypothetical protein